MRHSAGRLTAWLTRYSMESFYLIFCQHDMQKKYIRFNSYVSHETEHFLHKFMRHFHFLSYEPLIIHFAIISTELLVSSYYTDL